MLIGHIEEKQILIDWLNTFEKDMNTQSSCIITGKTGIGKSLLVDEAIQETDYTITKITPDDMPNKVEAKTFINQYIHIADIQQIFQQRKRKIVFVIDEIENLTFSQKPCLMEFLQYVYPSKKKSENSSAKKMGIPFIFIGQHCHLKVMQTLIKHSLLIELGIPKFEFQYKFVNETIDIENSEVIEMLIDHCQNDIRQLIILSEELRQYIKLNGKHFESIKNWFGSFDTIENEPDLMFATKMLFENNIPIDQCLSIYDTDRYLMPLMIHENIPQFYSKKIISLENLLEIYKIFICFDKIDSFMYQNQHWQLQDMCGTIICGGITSYLNDAKNCETKYNFTRHLNKVSLQTVKRNAINKLKRALNIDTMYGIFLFQQLYLQDPSKHELSPDITKILMSFNKVPSSNKSRNSFL